MAISLTEFIQQLISSNLLSDAEITACQEAASPADAEQFARWLVKQQKLTAFQAQQCYARKGQSLTLGNYVILNKLGQGGMGMVLKAEHRRMKRLVALKVLSPVVTRTPELLQRFQREVEAAARLSHPHIVQAHDADEVRGTHFLVMEYVPGSDLSSIVKNKGPLPLAAALNCVLQAAKGLDYAHQQGVIHRDIKPANLLLDNQGQVKILDMGLARLTGEGDRGPELTSTGAVMGTVDYMAPEQAESTRTAAIPADIYSLGCTLHFLLTGRPVYDGENLMQRLLAHRNQPIPSLSAQRPDIPADVDALFHKLVAKDPEARFASMAEVVTALEHCQSPDAAVRIPNARLTTSTDSQLQGFLQGLSTSVASATATRSIHQATNDNITPGQTPTLIVSAPSAVTQNFHGTAVSRRVEKTTRQRHWVYAAGGASLLALLAAVSVFVMWPRQNSKGALSLLPGQANATAQHSSSATPLPLPETSREKTVKTFWEPSTTQQAFIESVAGMPGDRQLSAVVAKLQEVNPGFDGKIKHKIENGQVSQLELSAVAITELWPIRGLPHLTSLHCCGASLVQEKLEDLAPLAGLPLRDLDVHSTMVSDLSPLQGMPLTTLVCSNTEVTDLSPLSGMPLTWLNCMNTAISDLSPLTGMPLTLLACGNTRVSDLTPLKGMPLTHLELYHTLVWDYEPIVGMPLDLLYVDIPLFDGLSQQFVQKVPARKLSRAYSNQVRPSDEFWKEFRERQFTAEKFATDTARLPLSQQIQAIKDRLRAVSNNANIAFTPVIRQGAIVEATVRIPGDAEDISPLRALTRLEKLKIENAAAWLDLSSLNSLPLKELTCEEGQIVRNGPILAAMPTLQTINGRSAEKSLADIRSRSDRGVEFVEPPPLQEWLAGRDILTVKKDGTAMFTTIQAALNAQQDGQVVRVLDKGPYRETLSWKDRSNCGLITEQQTVVEVDQWGDVRPGFPDKNGHQFYYLTNCRLHGFTFVFSSQNEHERIPLDFYLIEGSTIENCITMPAAPLPENYTPFVQIFPRNASSGSGWPTCIRNCVWAVGLRARFHNHGGVASIRMTQNWFHGPGRRDSDSAQCLSIQRSAFDHPMFVLIENNVIDSSKNDQNVAFGGSESILQVTYRNNTLVAQQLEAIAIAQKPQGIFRIQDNLHLVKSNSATFYNDSQPLLPIAQRRWDIARNYSPAKALSDSTRLPLGDERTTQAIRVLSSNSLDRNYLRIDPASITLPAGDPFPGALPPGPVSDEGDWFTRLQDRYRETLSEIASRSR